MVFLSLKKMNNKISDISKTLSFCIFLAIGVMAISASILAGELYGLHEGQIKLEKARADNEKIKLIINDYKKLLEKIESDPQILKRLESANLGIEPNEPNVAYPKITGSEFEVSRRAIIENMSPENFAPVIPSWIRRSVEPKLRLALFIAGAGLIFIAFSCFGSDAQQNEQRNSSAKA